jgi:hypothetical protein
MEVLAKFAQLLWAEHDGTPHHESTATMLAAAMLQRVPTCIFVQTLVEGRANDGTLVSPDRSPCQLLPRIRPDVDKYQMRFAASGLPSIPDPQYR